MATIDCLHQATEVHSLGSNFVQTAETQSVPRVDCGTHSTRTSCQDLPPSYPRIPRRSQFQANARKVQKPPSVIAPNEKERKNGLILPAQRNLGSRDEKKPPETNSLFSPEKYASRGSVPNSLKHKKSRKRDRQFSPPTDSDDEDPFHFDNILSSSTPKKKDNRRSSTLSSSLFRRASIVPVDPNAAPAPHRFSLIRERASDETIFVQEICDADGRRWSLRVPASGLPEDMVHMLEELEKLALELGQALPRIVVTCSAESLSLRRMELEATAKSSELLRPPPTANRPSEEGDVSGSGHSLAKEKSRLVEPEQVCGTEEPVGPWFHSKPAPTIQCPRQRAFFSALREPAKSSTTPFTKRLAARSTEPAPPSVKLKPKSRTQAKKSALPILKPATTMSDNNSTKQIASNSEVAGWATDRTRTLVSDTKSPNLPRPPQPPPPPPAVSAHPQAVLPSTAAAVAAAVPAGPQKNWSGQGVTDARRSDSAPAASTQSQSARKLRHLFRRPPVRSASDPPVYSVRQFTEGALKRPASEFVPAPREVVERRMPRLPSARDLLRKLA
ncbi:hypothetical protein BGW80DRAFT_1291170 [Lactifluus volemus]|nr:hypothetical protein BGW80DRAFT_1291170 [Lactifluus volemus]